MIYDFWKIFDTICCTTHGRIWIRNIGIQKLVLSNVITTQGKLLIIKYAI